MISSPRLLSQRYDVRSLGRDTDASRWLSPAEQDEFSRLRDKRRRSEWLAGRWLLKGMLWRSLTENGDRRSEIDLCDLEVFSRDPRGRGQPPRALFAGRMLPWHISLAHHSGIVWAAVSVAPDVRVGIDVVQAEPMDLRASDLWFTRGELQWLERSNDRLLGTTLWAVKEALYKATNRGEPFVPVQIEVAPYPVGGFTWSRAGIPCGWNDSIRVCRLSQTIVVTVSVCSEVAND